MAKKAISYNQAIHEIESILNKIENGNMDVDELESNVKKVSELLKTCKNKLHQTEKKVEDILKEMED